MVVLSSGAAATAPGLTEQLSAGSRDSKKESRPAPNFSSLPALSAGMKGGWALTETPHGEIMSKSSASLHEIHFKGIGLYGSDSNVYVAFFQMVSTADELSQL